MKIEDRIKKDIVLFEKNYEEVSQKNLRAMAYRYYEDAKYYLENKDYETAFGCINYAHGLLDAVRIFQVNNPKK
jgi:hypothetical protein